MQFIKRLIIRLLPALDIVIMPLVYPAAWLLGSIRSVGVQNMPWCRKALLKTGVFPVRNHYYEPQFDFRDTPVDSGRERHLPAIDWNVAGQLAFLERLTFAGELAGLPQTKPAGMEFYFGNGAFESGDAEYWYQLIRRLKPKRIFEIGSGYSTLLAAKAIHQNHTADPVYQCRHVCIEPYEMPWLEKTGVEVIREKVEDLKLAVFAELEANDILFIDSSHMIRPHGDVLYEYLELLPTLRPGVIVHLHDIFSPRNYPEKWIREEVKFWNEQYLLEAFLANNAQWTVLGALNFLHHAHYEKLKAAAPFLLPDREPGSFYLQKKP